MDNYANIKVHKVNIENRTNGRLSGIIKVISFDTELIMLETEKEMLEIKGTLMHVTRLDVDKGELEVEGIINSLNYSDVKNAKQASKKLISRLFK